VHGVYAFVMKTPEEIMIEREIRARRDEARYGLSIAIGVRSRAVRRRREVSTSTGRA
jgi:hypothetical protein